MLGHSKLLSLFKEGLHNWTSVASYSIPPRAYDLLRFFEVKRCVQSFMEELINKSTFSLYKLVLLEF